MRNSTSPTACLHRSIASKSLNGTCRELHLPLDNSFVSILYLRRIGANGRQSAELESSSEVELPPPMKMKTSTVVHRLYKNDAGCIQDYNHFAQPLRLYQSLVIR